MTMNFTEIGTMTGGFRVEKKVTYFWRLPETFTCVFRFSKKYFSGVRLARQALIRGLKNWLKIIFFNFPKKRAENAFKSLNTQRRKMRCFTPLGGLDRIYDLDISLF